MRSPLILVVCLLWVAACGPAEPPPSHARARLSGSSTLIEHFREAERETGVPAELLATVAWVQSAMSMNASRDADHEDHADDPHHPPAEWGLMAIGTGGLTTIEQAAEAVALSAREVQTDPRSNIRAGAALLAGHRGDADSYEAWSPALDAYGGQALTHAVLRLLATGFSAVDDAGQTVRVEGSGQTPELGTVQQALGYPGAIWSPAFSGNYTAASRGAATIDYVVIHTVQGSYAGAISWFKNPASNVSAHYVVRSSDGQITQCVDDSDIAWHDACFNTPSIGIEHEGFVSEPNKWYTDAMYKSSAKLTAWLSDKYGIPKDRQHILGHNEAPDCSTHTDPGPGWNWTLYMQLVKNGGVSDKDGDGVGDGTDNCPGVKNAGQLDTDKDGKGDSCDNDDDGDSIADTKDNCPKLPNKGQLDTDKDGKGDACDGDDDGDGIGDANDNCPKVKNAGQLDSDGDGKGDACEADDDGDGIVDADDNCPKLENADQLDTDADGKGDSCDSDDDGDGIDDATDNCPLTANADQLDTNGNGSGDACDDDTDADGIPDAEDLCPETSDPSQLDTDDDGQGDACDEDDDGDGVADAEDQCPTALPGSPEASTASGPGCDPDPTSPDPDDPNPEAPPSAAPETSEASSGCTTAPHVPGPSAVHLLLLSAWLVRRARKR